MSWAINAAARVQGEGRLGADEPRNAGRLLRRGLPQHHYQGLPEPELEIAQPPGFMGVAACLQRDSPSPAPIEPPWETRQPDTLMGPAVAMMYATHIVQDEATGVTYMDTVTTFMGRVALGNCHMAANLQGPTIEDITDLS